jgi:hypothetical protein
LGAILKVPYVNKIFELRKIFKISSVENINTHGSIFSTLSSNKKHLYKKLGRWCTIRAGVRVGVSFILNLI